MTIISTDTEGAFNGVTVSSNYQIVIVRPNVFLVADDGTGVYVNRQYFGGSIENYGNITGSSGVNVEDGGCKLTNMVGAVIQGDAQGVETIFGTDFSVVNDGLITGDIGIDSHSGTLSVINDGDIKASTDGMFMYGINNSISNFGSIKSNGDGIHLDQGGAATIRNYGLLQGLGSALFATDNASSCTLTNAGTISGDIRLGDAVNRIANTGSIMGDVSLGNGGSSFNGNGGTVTGTITGGTGADRIVAGNDGETLAGGAGHDTLFGGTGQDTFAFSSYLSPDSDAIHWFKAADDTIQLDHTVFKALLPGSTPVFATGSAATTTSDHLFYNGATGVLYYDTDGSGAAAPHPLATLDPALALTAHNFTVV